MNYWLQVVAIQTNLPETLQVGIALLLGMITFLSFLLVIGLSYLKIPKALGSLNHRFSSIETREIYQNVVAPHQSWLNWIIIVTVADIIILSLPAPNWLGFFEFSISLLIALNAIFLGFTLLKEVFDNYLLGAALENKNKINSELLVLAKFICNSLVVLIVIFLFAQTHQINVLGLIASLGVGGVAIAFASQKVIEQILWSVVIYIDRPFTIDDYIHLPDGTIGRVESIGWRSTKIRLSGKSIPEGKVRQNWTTFSSPGFGIANFSFLAGKTSYLLITKLGLLTIKMLVLPRLSNFVQFHWTPSIIRGSREK
jgi:MscS family membrane protein